MKNIIVGFSSSTKKFSPFSKLIRLWEGTDFSHVYFQFETSRNNVTIIYQASSTMLNYMSKEVFLQHNKVVSEFNLELSNEHYSELMLQCMKSAGLGYSIKQILGLAIAQVFRLKRNPFSDKEKYVCSEWVAEQLELCGFKFSKKLDLVTPKDIYELLLNR